MDEQKKAGKTWGQSRSPKQWLALIGLGLVAGFLSGMFGVGGGIIIVPGLMAVAHFTQKYAAGTSLATIIPLASVGVISYAVNGYVSLWSALILAAGAMIGTRIGVRLLMIVRPKPLQIGFSFFMVAAIVSMFFVVPSRDAVIDINWITGFGLLALGVITGTLAGLLGVGGGVIVVPALMLLFGASDLIARGTSLLMMIPTAATGTIANAKRKNVDLSAAAAIAIPACVMTFLGARTAMVVPPEVANIVFAAFLAIIAARLFLTAVFPGKEDAK